MRFQTFTKFSAIVIMATAAQSIAQTTPYVRATPPEKKNTIGTYPKLKNAKSWDGKEPGTYSIKFKITGVRPGDSLLLADYHLDGRYKIDTAVVDRTGIADFTGIYKLPRGMYILALPQMAGFFDFIVDDDQDFLITTDTAYYTGDYYTKMKVKGSDQNQGFVEYQLGKSKIVEEIIRIDEILKKDTSKAAQEPLKKKRSELFDQKNNYDMNYVNAHPDHLLSRFLYAVEDVEVPTELPTLADGTKDSAFPYRYYKEHFWDHVDLNEDGLTRMPVNVLKQRLDLYFDKILIPDADTLIKESAMLLDQCKNTIEIEKYLIWYLTNRFEGSNIMGVDKAFLWMASTTYCNGKAWWTDSSTVDKMCENAQRRKWTLIGEDAPTLELMDLDSNWVNTNAIKASYTIMIFWDPTCGHCREVMPKLAKIYQDNMAKGWKVIALSPGDKSKEFDEYIKQHPEVGSFLHLTRGSVRSEYYRNQMAKYYVNVSPTIFILDDQKEILANRIDVDKITEFIDHVDKQKKKKEKAN
jgi:thiol-disulfide isomerase/thioredoxin